MPAPLVPEGSKHSSNILNFSAGKQRIEILMAFVSDFFLEKKFELAVVQF